MDLNLLAVFEAVARTSSFSAAARELGWPKSSVSRGIARLEADLGTQLLFRTTREVAPTAAGMALYDRVAPALGAMRGAVGELPEQAEEPSGTLRVTAPVDIGVLFLAEVVSRYTARYPRVRVELTLTGRMVDLVKEGFDLALRVSMRLADSTLVVRRAAVVVMRWYASPVYLARRGTPRSEEELSTNETLAFRTGPERLRLSGSRSAATPEPAARIVADDLLFLRDAVRAGAGIALLPALVAEPEVLAGTLVRILPRVERVAGHIHIVTPGARHVPAKVIAFRDLVVELLRTRTGALAPA
jgi:DNA-binding transcriptional LysR family regulator